MRLMVCKWRAAGALTRCRCDARARRAIPSAAQAALVAPVVDVDEDGGGTAGAGGAAVGAVAAARVAARCSGWLGCCGGGRGGAAPYECGETEVLFDNWGESVGADRGFWFLVGVDVAEVEVEVCCLHLRRHAGAGAAGIGVGVENGRVEQIADDSGHLLHVGRGNTHAKVAAQGVQTGVVVALLARHVTTARWGIAGPRCMQGKQKTNSKEIAQLQWNSNREPYAAHLMESV